MFERFEVVNHGGAAAIAPTLSLTGLAEETVNEGLLEREYLVAVSRAVAAENAFYH
jgi:hypothetical protein